MLALAPVALAGFLVGLRHATDADHVAAVGAIVARERTVRGAALVGAAWGLGHTLTLLVLGGAIVVFGLSVPARVGLALELGVGLMLIGLGAWNVAARTARSALVPAPAFAHDGAASEPTPPPAARALRPLVVGSMHGLAGSAAAALLVVATARGTSWGLAYLLVFGVGTMVGMTALTTALALPLRSALERSRRAESWVRVGSGLLSFAIGALVVYEVGFHEGLFLR
jgi:high-affinity nickel-transport protein